MDNKAGPAVQSTAICRMEESSMTLNFIKSKQDSWYEDDKPARQSAPRTARGSFWGFAHAKTRVWCLECQSLQFISECHCRSVAPTGISQSVCASVQRCAG